MINQPCPFPCRCRLSEDETDASGAGIDDAMHSFRAAMKTLRRTAAHRGLLTAVAIQTSHDRIGDLIDQGFIIAVFRERHCRHSISHKEAQKVQMQKMLFVPFCGSSLVLALDRVDLGDAFSVSLFADLGREPGRNDLAHLRAADCLAA